MKFLVWCLSWDDTSENACAVETGEIGKYVPPTSRRIVDCGVGDSEGAAEAYADYCHSHRDGWEDSWPLTFRVRSEDGTKQDFEVSMEAEPAFTAREVKS